MRRRSIVTTCLSPAAFSNTSLFWATIIGGFGTLVLVPGPTTHGLFSLPWLLVVLASQAALAACILGARHLRSQPSPANVCATLFVAGALRGTVVAIGAGLVGVQEISAGNLLNRSLNSAVITVIGIGLIGGTIAWRQDFATQYRVLRARALALEHARDDDEIDPEILRTWTTIKGSLDGTLQQATDRLANGTSPDDLNDAARLITRAIDTEIRPASHDLWPETIPDAAAVRVPTLLREVFGTWRLPLPEVLVSLGLIVGVGSLVRSGILAGGLYTLRYLVVTGVALWLSQILVRLIPRFTAAIAATTLLSLPVVLLFTDRVIGGGLLQLPADPIGQLVVALATPIAAVFITMAVNAVRHRSDLLNALQRRIDDDVATLLVGATKDAQQLSVFMHHSVQSELAAIALNLREAASTDDANTADAARRNALKHLDELAALDPDSPPWLQKGTSITRIHDVVAAWQGIASIELGLPPEDSLRADQWHVAERVIEEGLANAVRHGHATRIEVIARAREGILELEISDDGSTDPASAPRGIGSQWLDRIAPGDWELVQTSHGARLRVRIR